MSTTSQSGPTRKVHASSNCPAGRGIWRSTRSPYRSDVRGVYRGSWGPIWGPAPGQRVRNQFKIRTLDNGELCRSLAPPSNSWITASFLHYTKTKSFVNDMRSRPKQQLLLGDIRTLNEDLSQTLGLTVIKNSRIFNQAPENRALWRSRPPPKETTDKRNHGECFVPVSLRMCFLSLDVQVRRN
jgi:hypothetical protein